MSSAITIDIDKLKKQINEFLKEKINRYLDILVKSSDYEKLSKELEKENEIIKNVILSLIVEDVYIDSLSRASLLKVYSEKLSNILDYQTIRNLLINRIISYGLNNKKLLEKFSTEELFLIYYNFYIFDKHKSTVKQIKEILKLFNLNLISVAQLYIVYDKNTNDIFFAPEWIYNPLKIKIKKFDYETIVNSTPGFMIDKQTILDNKDNILFPIKSNILLINTSSRINLANISYLRAVVVSYILKDKYIDVNLPVRSYIQEHINVNDIPIITSYIRMKYYYNITDTREYYNNRTDINTYTRNTYVLSLIYDYFDTRGINRIIDILNNPTYEEYRQLNKELKELFNKLSEDEYEYLKNTNFIEVFENYIKDTYPSLYEDLLIIENKLTDHNNNNNNTRVKLDTMLSNILTNLISLFVSIVYTNPDFNKINEQYLFDYIHLFFYTDNDIISQHLSKYILLIKYFLPLHMHLTRFTDQGYYIEDLLNTIHTHDYYSVLIDKHSDPDIILDTRYNFNLTITNEYIREYKIHDEKALLNITLYPDNENIYTNIHDDEYNFSIILNTYPDYILPRVIDRLYIYSTHNIRYQLISDLHNITIEQTNNEDIFHNIVNMDHYQLSISLDVIPDYLNTTRYNYDIYTTNAYDIRYILSGDYNRMFISFVNNNDYEINENPLVIVNTQPAPENLNSTRIISEVNPIVINNERILAPVSEHVKLAIVTLNM